MRKVLLLLLVIRSLHNRMKDVKYSISLSDECAETAGEERRSYFFVRSVCEWIK